MRTQLVAGALAVLALAGCSAAQPAAQPVAATTTSSSSTSSAPTSDTPTPTPSLATFAGGPSDFKIGVKILKKTCFGSAGCNVTYRIVPEYVGLDLFPGSGTIEVTYVVKGLEDGDAVNTFTIDSAGTASFDSEELGSVSSSKVKLTARATDVSFQH